MLKLFFLTVEDMKVDEYAELTHTSQYSHLDGDIHPDDAKQVTYSVSSRIQSSWNTMCIITSSMGGKVD